MNKSHSLTVLNLLASLPQVLQSDESMAALAQATAEVLEKRSGEIQSISIYPNIDALSEDLLDILANDFKIDWWDPECSVEKKRALLKNSWHVHHILGTKTAVMTALADIYSDATIREWWEYGGDPGCFRVETSNHVQAFSNLDKFFAILNGVKRLSAHLDSVCINFESEQKIGAGIASQTCLEITYRMEIPSAGDFADLVVLLTDESGAYLTDENGENLIE